MNRMGVSGNRAIANQRVNTRETRAAAAWHSEERIHVTKHARIQGSLQSGCEGEGTHLCDATGCE